MSTRSIRRISPRLALPLAIAALAVSCERGPTDPEVSETEIWRLELEQVDDGSTGSFVLRRRGTINLLLRLNHTTTPDPACAAQTNPNATTFLASVEALPSRLQPPTNGTATGTWNCFGFSAEVRLNDGTIYQLTSERTFDHHRYSRPTPNTGMLPNRWAAGLRLGHFLLAPDTQFTYRPFDSHLDVRVENRQGRSLLVGLGMVNGNATWEHRDVHYRLVSGVRGVIELAAEVSAGQSYRFSWPVSPASRWSREQLDPASYEILAGEHLEWWDSRIARIHCFLGSGRTDEAQLIIEENGDLACGYGWLRELVFAVSPSWLFMRPGTLDTLTVKSAPGADLSVGSSNPAVGAAVLSFARTGGVDEWKVAVSVTREAPRTEHGVTLMVEHATAGVNSHTVPVEVYELDVTAAPDTITVARGDSGSATIRLAKVGLLGLDLGLSVPDLPQGVLLVPPSFRPSVTRVDSSILTLRVDGIAQPGTYPLTVCAIIVADPRETCHAARLTLRVTEPLPGNRSPVAVNDSVATMQGTAIEIDVLANDSDPDGDALTIARVSTPTSGTAVIIDNGQRVRYRALANFTGTASFTYAARDVHGAESNEATVKITVLASGGSGYDLQVVKTASRSSVAAGDTVVFTLEASNLGPGAPVGAAVRDVLPSGLSYVADDGGGAYNPANGIWSLGPLPAGQSRTLRITATASATATNTATILSESGQDRNGANNASSVTVTVR